MSDLIDLALMAGASYVSNRGEKNRFTIAKGWEKISVPDSYVQNPDSGFEAVSFIKSNEIVISFAQPKRSTKGVSIELFSATKVESARLS